ncbi:von Willebrand factor A domain-containing protein 3B-like [Tubulanus polymorphus]|uniref:von Willebrand factor A domain-containing protein 3B-like n=1 Tax=Tubulanus polymorphus TaxID=672921 RepID=UPI003DA2CE07
MATLDVDIIKKTAYGEGDPSFDLNMTGAADVVASDELVNADLPPKKSRVWELDVRALISSKKWLQNYGLKRNRLDLYHILPQIGFKHNDDFDLLLRKPISSRYGDGLFQQLTRQDGKIFNLVCGKEKLKQIEQRLVQAIVLYKRRLEWLTSESRRLFGVIQEHSICIVIDIKNMSPQQFDQYRAALERVLTEQVSLLAKFNLIRAAEDVITFKDACVPVTQKSIDEGIEWIWGLDRLECVAKTATCEALKTAFADKNLESVYLFTEGSASDGSKRVLQEKLNGGPLPLHIVSYNCKCSDTIQFLQHLAKTTGGRFHAYSVIMEMDSYEGLPVDPNTSKTNIVLKKKLYGGVPAGAGCREDVILLFEELEEARNTLSQIQSILSDLPDPKTPLPAVSADVNNVQTTVENREQYMASKEWLETHGIKAKKLGFYDVLGGVAFKHCDGIVGLKDPPARTDEQTDAIPRDKLVNAKYCDKFAHVKWRDGRIVHVQVTQEIYRNYEQRMSVAINNIEQRIDWLQQGSRALFGTVIEEQIYIIVDTSGSMEPSMDFVKDKMYILMQEQLRHKQRFNILAFNSRVYPWRDRLVDVCESNLQSAWQWVKDLTCQGSTNTLAALRFALADRTAQAIYLLTDGRPDQIPKSILAQVQLKKSVPIHTISFNCADAEANKFLCQLAKDTNGRYHYYSEHGEDPEGPEPWESEDIQVLKDELCRAKEYLGKISQLRDECIALAWRRDPASRQVHKGDEDIGERPKSSPGFRVPTMSHQAPRPSSSAGYHPSPHASHRKPMMAKKVKSPRRISSHTKTSLLRTLSSSGRFSPDAWLLPETREIFDRQWERQRKMQKDTERKAKAEEKRKKKMVDPLTMSSRQWLRKHGLVAKKLTILDVLAPTMIPHRPKYVPIIDKEVVAKVFDDILPFAHTTSSGQKSMQLINPNAVDLNLYETKLTKTIKLYQRRLGAVIWKALPKSQKESFNSDKPVPFVENRKELINALEKCGWPISELDITLLEDEIEQAEKYLAQSQKLREAVKNSDIAEEDENLRESSSSSDEEEKADAEDAEKESIASSRSSSASSMRSSVSEVSESKQKPCDIRVSRTANLIESVKSVLERPLFDNGQFKCYLPILKNQEFVDSRDNNRESQRTGSGKMRNRKLTDKNGTLSTVSIESSQGKENHSKPTNNVTSATKRDKLKVDPLRGQSCVSRHSTDGLYYPGTVIKSTDTRHALVKFDKMGKCVVPSRFIIPTGGAVACPMLQIGDYVLVRAVNIDSNKECYVPGIVRNTPFREQGQTRFYTVVFYTGQRTTVLRNSLIKISKSRFSFAIRFLKDSYNTDDENFKTEIHPYKNPKAPQKNKTKTKSSRGREVDGIMNEARSSVSEYTESDMTPEHKKSITDESTTSERDHKKSKRRDILVDPRHLEILKEQLNRLDELQHELEQQQRKQERRQKKLRQETRKLAKAQQSFAEEQARRQEQTERKLLEEHHKLLKKQEEILEKYEENQKKINESDKLTQAEIMKLLNENKSSKKFRDERTKDWVSDQSSPRVDSVAEIGDEVALKKDAESSKVVTKDKDSSKGIQRPVKNKKKSRKSKNSPERDLDKKIADNETSETPTSTVQLEMRLANLPLKEGEEVLARWSDEGWYYRGTIAKVYKDNLYLVEDACNDLEQIWREDIIADADDADQVIQIKDTVIGLHPKYSYSYAPGVVLDVFPDLSLLVRFYDGIESHLLREDVYKIPTEKFDKDVKFIVECEEKWIGQAVIARNDDTGAYNLASVKERLDCGNEFVLVWADGSESEQSASCIFGPFTKRHPLTVGDKVLAVADEQTLTYLPGRISTIAIDKLAIRFCNGKKRENFEPMQVFWLSKDFYNNATMYFKSKENLPTKLEHAISIDSQQPITLAYSSISAGRNS